MYSELIAQINWELYRRGYWIIGDLERLKRKIREARDNDTELDLTDDEKYQLKGMVVRGINKIQNYEYGEGIDAEKLRKESLEPLYQLLTQLNTEER